jgi:DNA-binding MarR family transcriptional regulator
VAGLEKKTVSRVLAAFRERGLAIAERGKQRRLIHYLTPKGVGFLASIRLRKASHHIAAFGRAARRDFQMARKAVKAISSAVYAYRATQWFQGISAALEYAESHGADIRFLDDEFQQEGVDFLRLPYDLALGYLQLYLKRRGEYRRLRKGGLRPLEALEWADELGWILAAQRLKWLPAAEWALPKSKRLREAPLRAGG